MMTKQICATLLALGAIAGAAMAQPLPPPDPSTAPPAAQTAPILPPTPAQAAPILPATPPAAQAVPALPPPAPRQQAAPILPPTPPAATVRMAVATSNVNLRGGPSTNAPILTTIPEGSRVQVGNCTPEWCGVSWNGRSGFAIARVFDSSVVRRVRRPVEPVYVQRPVVVAPPPVYYGSPYYYGPPVVVYGPRYYRSWGYGYRRW